MVGTSKKKIPKKFPSWARNEDLLKNFFSSFLFQKNFIIHKLSCVCAMPIVVSVSVNLDRPEIFRFRNIRYWKCPMSLLYGSSLFCGSKSLHNLLPRQNITDVYRFQILGRSLIRPRTCLVPKKKKFFSWSESERSKKNFFLRFFGAENGKQSFVFRFRKDK